MYSQKPGGFGTFVTSSCFGTSSTGQLTGGLFGTNTGTASSLFGETLATSAFGGASAGIAIVGTTIAFNPPNGQDTTIKSGVTTNINTKHKCITAMKEYENKSLEELRIEDYNANRKAKQAVSTNKVGLFSSTAAESVATRGFAYGGGLGSGLQTSTKGFRSFGTSSTGQPTGSLFGINTGATSSLFRATSATSAFGGASEAVGTTIAFNPPNGQDTTIKSGVTTNINTKHQCITAMKEYENKSLEELRIEDYNANRKVKQAGSTSTVGLFGSTSAATRGFVFGGGFGSGLQTSTTGFGSFGTSSTGQPTGGMFRTHTRATSNFFGGTSTTSAFGGANAGIAAISNPPNGQDTVKKRRVITDIYTKHQCIIAMTEYENMSLQELRIEDYNAKRKAKQAGSTSTVGLFSSTATTPAATTGFVFGGGLGSGLQTNTTGFGSFGTSSTGQPTGSLFGINTGVTSSTTIAFNRVRQQYRRHVRRIK